MAQATFIFFLLAFTVQAKIVVYEGKGGDCSTLLYTETFNLSINKGEKIDLTEAVAATTTCSVVDVDGRAMEISWGDISETIKALKVAMTFSRTQTGYWNSQKMTVSYTNGTDDLTMTSNFRPVSLISTSFSFACSLQSKTTLKTAGDSGAISAEASVVLDKYQIEVYKTMDGKFSSTVQCVNWISKGAWMGIVAGLLTITVLVMSVLMLLSASTPDKFESSKSKCLLIPHEH